jgi:hypothetical protein
LFFLFSSLLILDFSVHVRRAMEEYPDDARAQARIISGPEAAAAQEWAERVLAASITLADYAAKWDEE